MQKDTLHEPHETCVLGESVFMQFVYQVLPLRPTSFQQTLQTVKRIGVIPLACLPACLLACSGYAVENTCEPTRFSPLASSEDGNLWKLSGAWKPCVCFLRHRGEKKKKHSCTCRCLLSGHQMQALFRTGSGLGGFGSDGAVW